MVHALVREWGIVAYADVARTPLSRVRLERRTVTLRRRGSPARLEVSWGVALAGASAPGRPWPPSAAEVLARVVADAAEVDGGPAFADWLEARPARDRQRLARVRPEHVRELFEARCRAARQLAAFLGPDVAARLTRRARAPQLAVELESLL